MIGPTLQSIAEMFGLFGIGYLAHRLKILDRSDVDRIAKLIFDILYTCLIFGTVVPGLDVSRLSELWVLPLLGLGIMLVGFALGFVLKRGVKNDDPEVRRVFHHMCAINNFGFLPIFIIDNSMPPEALALFFVFNLGSTLGYWTLGVLTLGSTGFRATARKLLSPPLVALFASLVLTFLGAKTWVPDFVLGITQKAGSIAVPLSLIVIGVTLAGSFRREFFRDIALLSIARLILLPAAAIGIAWWLPLAGDVRTIFSIVAVMPATATAVIMTRIYGGSSEFAAAGTLATTVASAVTVPTWLYFLLS